MLVFVLFVLLAGLQTSIVKGSHHNKTWNFDNIPTRDFPPRSALTVMPQDYSGFIWTSVYVGRVQSANCMIVQSDYAGFLALPQPNKTHPVESITPQHFHAGCYGGVHLGPVDCFIHVRGYNRTGTVVADDVYAYKVTRDKGSKTRPGSRFHFNDDYHKVSAFTIVPLQSPTGNRIYAYMTHLRAVVHKKS